MGRGTQGSRKACPNMHGMHLLLLLLLLLLQTVGSCNAMTVHVLSGDASRPCGHSQPEQCNASLAMHR